MIAKPLISVLIVNYNGKDFLKPCLDSVLAQTFKDFEIILVDNCSSDLSIEFVKNLYDDKRLKLYSLDSNKGFAGGNNYAFSMSSGEYIVLLNNDVVVEGNWLEELYSFISVRPDAGIVQSLVLTEGIPEKYYKKNGTVNLLGHNIMEIFNIGSDGIGEIFQATGCSMIIRRSAIEKFGYLFPDEYFAYAEDTFLCFRIKFAGLNIYHNAKSIVHHKGGATSDKIKFKELAYYRERNRLLNFLVFFDNVFIVKYFPYLIFNFFMKTVLGIIRSSKYPLSSTFRAYYYFISNRNKIKEKRQKLNESKVSDNEYVLGYITSKIFNGNNFAERFINYLSYLYCKITVIKTLENKKVK